MPPTIKIEPVSMRHAGEIQSLVTSHPAIVAYTRLPDPYPPNGAKEWIESAIPKHEKGEEYNFVIKNSRGHVAGVCGLIVDKEKNEAELGYWIGYKFWNRGLATAAIRELVSFALEEKNLRRIFALSLVRNEASCRVLEKNSFKQIEIRRNTYPKWKPTDRVAVYEMTSDQWKEQ